MRREHGRATMQHCGRGATRRARLRLLPLAIICLAGVTFASVSLASAAYGPTVLHFHGNPTDDSGCTGAGAADIVACGGPSLLARDTLGSGPAAHWDVADPVLDGTSDRNIYDPNWVWNLPAPTTLSGQMTVQWWASSGASNNLLPADWTIRLWADGTKVFEQQVTATLDTPNVPKLLTATVNLPTVSASSTYVLHIDPVYIDAQANTHIYYDSQLPCPGAASGVCDSQVTMPVADPNATPTPTPTPTGGGGSTPTPTPTPTAGTPRYTPYLTPPGYGDDSGEPSIGVNWNTGKVMYFGGFSTDALRVTFDDRVSPARVTWEKTPLTLAATQHVLGDPILFTDHETGRTLVSQLEGGTKQSTTDYTDDDGAHYQPSQGSGINSGVDHQTIGGGPFAPGLSGAGYKNAVYYCAQDDVAANCALSLDGGRTFGPAVPIYTLADCVGIHGHVKVAPDGTAYVPNKRCGGQAAVAVSENNGLNWEVRRIPGSDGGVWDPSVGIATDGTIYVGYNAADNHARIAVSHDKGKSWSQPFDAGAQLGLQNTVFPAVVAGDPDRAAYAFYGTTAGGNYDDNAFSGVWYLYVASTFDGGRTWTTVNATPDDPVQRGRICGGGTGCALPGGGGNTRNLLDFFDATIDREGRVLVGYDDGCIGPCVQSGPNSFTAKGAIARQSGGRRMFAAYDPVEPGVPAAPDATAMRTTSGAVHLSWPAPDNGGSPITGYRIYRRTDASGFAPLASVAGTSYDDATATGAASYFYRVTAVNAYGEGPAGPDAAPGGSSRPVACDLPGLSVIDDVRPDGTDDDAAPNMPADQRTNIKQLYVAEPYLGAGVSKLVFTLKLAPAADATLPPSSQWYIIWNRLQPDADFDRYYVALKTDALGAASYEYGKFGVPLPIGDVPNPNSNTAVKLGDADSGSYDPATGTVRITLSTAKAENIQPGQHLHAINVRTFLAQPDSAIKSQRLAADITGDSDYTLIDNAVCKVNNPPTANLSATPIAGTAPLLVSFDASGSSDRDGDALASYTFNFGDGSPAVTQATANASHTYAAGGNYFATLTVTDSQGARSTNVASAAIQVSDPPKVESIEDDDARIAYSDAWHLVSDASASAGHFRYHTGNSPNHSAVLGFDVPSGKTGALTYYFARSPKGGTADLYLDGVLKGTVNYQGSAGATQKPEFADACHLRFEGLAAGSHRLEIRNMSGVVYLDRFVLESAGSNAQPAAGPGQTSNQSSTVGGGQTASSAYQVPTGARSLSVAAESSLSVPFQLVLVDPTGVTLQTASATGGIATINQPLTKGGLYVVKVVNLNLGPLQLTTTTTPLVAR